MWINSDEDYRALERRLAGAYASGRLALRFSYLPQAGSTNTCAKGLRAGLERPGDGVFVFTRHQTAGRGTRDRTWLQEPGRDAAVTLALALDGVPDPRVSLVAGAAVAQAVEGLCGRPAGVKWPNDVLLEAPGAAGGYWAKVAGLLLETTSHGPDEVHLIIGVGLNCNSRAAGFPPELRGRVTTLSDVAGRPVDACVATERLVAGLVTVRDAVLAGDFAGLLAEWGRRDRTGGSCYVLNRGGTAIPVTAVRVELPAGNLVVADDEGREYTVTSYTELSAPGE